MLLRMVEAGVTPNDVSWNTLMSGYRTGEERNAVLLRMVEAGVTPNEVSWNTLMSGYADEGMSLQCLSSFCRMQNMHISPNVFTLSILFTCLVRDGSSSAIRTVAHFAACRVASHSMISHFVAFPVLSALAFVGSDNDIVSFWGFCARHLGRSKEGWPGLKCEEMLRQRCRRNRGSGWTLLLALIDGRRSADCAAAWPPEVMPPATDMMARAASLAAGTEPFSSSGSGICAPRGGVAHDSRSPSPPAPAAPAAAPAAASAPSASAPRCSRSITCKDCGYVHGVNVLLWL